MKSFSFSTIAGSGKLVGVAVVLAVATLVPLAPGALADTPQQWRERIANTYGAKDWSQVEVLRYTFNIKAGEREVARQWEWHVKDGRVVFTDVGAGKEPFTYNTSDVTPESSDDLRGIDHRFINDQYWFLFCLHVGWDTDATVTVEEDAPLPIGDGTATKVTMQYPDTGGYTPGDAYDLYVGDDARVKQWVFRKGGKLDDGSPAIWDTYRTLGPLLVATEFYNEQRTFKLFFTDLAVKLTGSDEWVPAR